MRTHVLCLLLFVAGAATAADVYRCGPDGRSYSDQPCAEGRTIDVADARSGEQAAAAREVAQRDHDLVQQLAAERRAQERRQANLPAGFRVGTPVAATKEARARLLHGSQPHPHRRHPKLQRQEPGEGVFRAVVPVTRRTKG